MSDREQTFLGLVRDNRARLRRICRAYARGPEAEKDLYQDILAEAWRSLSSFDGDAGIDTWLYRVALNTALARRRKEKVRHRARLDEDDPVRGAEIPRPDDHLARKSRIDRLYEAIDRLDEMDRALVLLYMDDCSYAEMSDVLGISENYVGVKLHRIRKKLGEWLSEEPE